MAANQGGIYSVLDDERINARADFFAGLGMGIDGSWAPRVGSIIGSNSEIENYNWIGTAPQMSVWEGEALLQELPNYEATLKNIEYISGLRVQKADIRRDKTGQIRQRIGDLGKRTGTHWETLVSTLILGGETATGTDLRGKAFDGKSFFATDHTYANSNFTTSQSNDLSSGVYNISTATAPTAVEAAAILVDMVGNFWTLKDDQGEPINGDARSFLVMVGTNALHAPLRQAISAENLSSGESNQVRGLVSDAGVSLNVVLNPRLSANTTKVYMFRTDAPLGPFILQDEVGVNVAEEDPGMLSKHINVAATATRSAGYGLWQNALLATLS